VPPESLALSKLKADPGAGSGLGQISEQMWSLWPLLIQCFHEWAIDYFENILVPLDNFISRGTDTFLSGQNPNYLQQVSTWSISPIGSELCSILSAPSFPWIYQQEFPQKLAGVQVCSLCKLAWP
jgi:hypothetical protein